MPVKWLREQTANRGTARTIRSIVWYRVEKQV